MSTLTSSLSAQTAAARPQPPVANKVRSESHTHGLVLADDYAWLRDKANPEVERYLEAENAYADAVLQPAEPLRHRLYSEMVAHIKQTDENVPYKDGGYYYYARTEEGRQYPILCRKCAAADGSLADNATEQVMLDINQLAQGEPFMALGGAEVSDDGNLLAYSTDNTGFRQYRLRIRDLRTGQDLADSAENTGSIVWAADNRTVFYTVEDHAKRQYRLYRHALGASAASDSLLYEEVDERFGVGAYRSRSKRFIFVQLASHTTSETRYFEAVQSIPELKMIEPRRDEIEYDADHHGDHFYLRVNDTGRTFRLVSAPIAAPGKANWKEIVPARAEVMMSEAQLFQDFYVLVERENGLPVFRVGRYGKPGLESIQFPEPTYNAFPRDNAEWETASFRYAYQSLLTPASVFDYDVHTQRPVLRKQTEVPGYDPSQYASERVWATARDGVKMPVSLVYRRDTKTEGKNPLYVYGYGAYGIVTAPNFSSNRLSLLDRGVVIAIAHIRGSGDLGKAWHDDGKMMHKKNTFTDFIDCVEWLAAHGYGDRARIAIEGGSAGGLLMAAVTNLRPELFRAVVAHVPFVDVMNTMLDASLPLTVGEYEEWGNPHEKEAYEYMRGYSPYDNLRPAEYPAMLVKTSFHDSQVMYWEPAKYTAKLRTLKQDHNPLLLKTNMAAGHGGASGRYDYLHEVAFDYAFMLGQLGVEKL